MTGSEAVLSRNRTAQFVSWHHAHTTWDPKTETRTAAYKRGKYQGSNKTHWLVLIDGQPTQLDKDKWTPCLK